MWATPLLLSYSLLFELRRIHIRMQLSNLFLKIKKNFQFIGSSYYSESVFLGKSFGLDHLELTPQTVSYCRFFFLFLWDTFCAVPPASHGSSGWTEWIRLRKWEDLSSKSEKAMSSFSSWVLSSIDLTVPGFEDHSWPPSKAACWDYPGAFHLFSDGLGTQLSQTKTMSLFSGG